jgi:NADH-quinone oxidoreductase subunit J
MNILFYIASLVAIVASIMVITRRNAVHALLYLVLSLLAIAVVFYSSGAPYAAALEIIVYAGAIVILFVFVVMMLNLNKSPEDEKSITGYKTWIIPTVLSLILIVEFIYAFITNNPVQETIQVVGVKQIAISMYTTYLLGAELIGILLLAGIVGAYHLGRTKKRNLHRYLEVSQESETIENENLL